MDQPNIIRSLTRLWGHTSVRRRAQLFFLFLLSVIASFAEVVSIGAVLPFLGVLTAPESVFAHPYALPLVRALEISSPGELLLPLTLLFTGAALFSGGMRLLLLWAQTRIGHSIGAEFSAEIYRRTLYQPYSVHVARNSSDIIAGITSKTSILVNNTILPFLTIFSSIVILIFIISALVFINPAIAISACAGFGLIYTLVIGLTKRGLARDSERISRESSQVIKALQEGLGGIRDVLLDGTQEFYRNIFRQSDVPLRRAIANVQIVSGSPRFAIETLAMVLIAWLSYGLSGRSESFVSVIPVLGALALGAQRMLPVLQQIYVSIAAIRGGMHSLSDALELLEQPLPEVSNLSSVAPIAFADKLVLKGVGFAYDLGTVPTLDKIDLTIPFGSRVGFMGATGSGKSTLLNVVMGLLEPTQGSIFVDGVELDASNLRSWQMRIAHVPQSIFLADTTIAENIAFGVARQDIDEDRLRKAAEGAQIDAVIKSMPIGYETIAGEGGIRLSGGQRQRLGIARALYKRADVIVLDEATSALDNDTERSVMQSIIDLGSDYTVLIVAHRLTTLSRCDFVVELDRGKVTRIGSYSEITGDQVQ